MNTTHLSVKKTVIALIVGLLSSFVVFSQTPTMEWSVNVENLKVGYSGLITIRGENNTNASIGISNITLPSYQGVEILQNPPAKVLLNGVSSNFYAAEYQYNPYGVVYVQPHSSIELSYRVAAKCEAIYEAGDSITVLEQGKIKYSNGTEENLDRASFSISYPRLQLVDKRMIIGEENQADLILKIVNLMQGVPAQNIRFNINFTNDARPLSQDMYAQISKDGEHWSNSIWTGGSYNNPSEFNFTNANLQNIGLEGLQYGDTLYVKYALQLTPSISSYPLEYELLFADSLGNYCSNQTERGTISILRQTGIPNLTISQKDIEPFDFCGTQNGRMAVTIKNIGDGVAYINTISLGNGYVIPQSAQIAGVNVLGASGRVSMPTTNIDGDGGLEDVNRDNNYSELAAGDSITIEVEYALSSSYILGASTTYSLTQKVEYVSSSDDMLKTVTSNLSGGISVSRHEITGADIVNLEQSNSYEYNLNLRTTVLPKLMYSDYICYFSAWASDGITINGSSDVYHGTFTSGNFSETLQLKFDENASPCHDYYLNISYGVKNEECGRTKTLGNINKLITVENNIQLNTNVNDVLLTDFTAYRTNYGWKLSDVNNMIPYKRELEKIQKLTREESSASNVVSRGDTVHMTLLGEYNIIDNSYDFISATISKSNYSPLLNYIRGTYQIGSRQGVLTKAQKPFSDDFYFKIPIETMESSHDSIRIDVWCLVEDLSTNEDVNHLSAYLQMEKSEETAEIPCIIKKQDIIGFRRNINKNSSTSFCRSNIRLSTTKGYNGEYNPNLQVSKITIFREGGLSLDKDGLRVYFQVPTMEIPIHLYEDSDKYELRFGNDDTLLLDVSTLSRYLFVDFHVRYLNYETSSKNVPIQIEGMPLYYLKLSDNPIVSISQPNVASTQTKTVSWDVSVSGNTNGKNLYFKWRSNQMRLIDIRNLDGTVLTKNDSNKDSIFFKFPFEEGTSTLTFTAEVQDCANNDTLRSLLQAAIECDEIDETAFDTLALEYYNRNLDATVNSISLPVTQPTFETRYMNLCDTAYYSFQISNLGADTSNISFWLDNISENVNVKTVEANIDSDTYQLGNYNTPSSRNITTDVLRNSSTDNIDEANTIVNIGLSVECDPTKNHIDITKPINAHVLRYDICNNPIQEDFSIKPNIKGFENMDSIRFTAIADDFNNQGIGTVSVSLQNNDLQLIDSVDFTVILPEGLEYVENSTTPNYFSSIQNDGQSVVWAFERNKHVDGNENLQFTFQVRNANRCERRNDTLKMATSLERTLHGSCGDACLVKKTSDTIQITMQQEPVKLIESITTDKNSVCAGDSFIVSVQDNNNGIYTLSAEPTGMVSIDGNTITTNPQVSGHVTIKATATDGDCQDEAQTTVTIKALPHPAISPLDTSIVEKGKSIPLFAYPAGGVWSGTDVKEYGEFKANHSGVHTIYYTVTNGECSNTDSVQITVVSCDKEIFIEPETLNVSEQASIITIPVSISPIEECGYCSELRSMKFNITFDGDVLDYSGAELQQLQQSVDMYDRLENNTVVVQLYSNTVNGFVTDGGELLYLTFNVKRNENTDVSISNGYYNGEYASDNLTGDMISIFYMPKPTVTLHDTVFCAGGQVELVPVVDNPSNGELRYVWNTRQSTPTLTVSRAGDYVVTVYDSFDSYDSKHVVVSEAPAIIAGLADTAFCEGMSVTLQPDVTQGEISQYEWNTGENTAAISVSSAGTYTVTMTDIYGCTSGVPANVTVNENSEIPVFTYNRNNMDSYTATISNAVENNVYMWHGSEGVTFDSNQSPSVTISVASYPAAICVESQDENGCTSVSHCDTIPLTPPISIAGNRVICFSQQEPVVTTDYRINEPKFNAQYEWEVTNNAQLFQHNAQEASIQFRVGMGTVSLTVRERINGEITRETTIAIEQRIRPNDLNYQNLGDNNVCNTAENVIYTVSGNASEYHWEVPANAEIVSGQGTNQIAVNFNGTSGNIVVHAQNGEGCLSYGGVYYSVNVNGDCPPQEYSLKSLTLSDEEQNENDGTSLDIAETYLNVYPLPVKHILTISTNATIQRVIVYDVVGGIVMQKQNVTQIDVSNLLAGNYFVQIETDKGTFTKPIVVVK